MLSLVLQPCQNTHTHTPHFPTHSLTPPTTPPLPSLHTRTASDLQLYLIDDAGHNPFLEQPERFHDALAEALRPWLTGEKKHLVHTVASESALPVHPDDPPQPEAVAADL